MNRYFKSSHGISTHSQKLSVPSIALVAECFLKWFAILCLLHATHCAKTVVHNFLRGIFSVRYKSRIAVKLVNNTNVFPFVSIKKDKINSLILGLLYLIEPKSFGINKSAWVL